MADATGVNGAAGISGGATGQGTYNGPTPGAGAFGVYQTQADQAYQSAVAATQAQRAQFLTSQGLDGQYDPTTGAFTGVSIDPNAPGGAYQQMLGQNTQAVGQQHAAASALGFGGGLAQQQQEQAQQAVSANAANWANQAVGTLAGFNQQDIQASQTQQNNEVGELENEINTAIQNGTFNPANYVGLTIPGYGTITAQTIGALSGGQTGSTGSTGGGNGITAPPVGGGSGKGSGGSGGKQAPQATNSQRIAQLLKDLSNPNANPANRQRQLATYKQLTGHAYKPKGKK